MMDGHTYSADGLSPDDLEALAGGSYRPGPDHDAKPDSGPAAAAAKPSTVGITLIRADGIKPERINWVWTGWLARGKVHVMAGAPGTGKTTAAVGLAATMTTGGRWPDGSRAPIGDVLIWSGEDDPKDTLIPRLIASGADLRRVHFIASHTDEKGHPRAFDPATDINALSDHLATMSPAPALLIVDPIVSAIAGDSHKNAEVRRSLQPLVDLATLRGVAVLGISHFSKGTQGRDPTERVTGSLAFGALARVVLATAKLSDDEGGGRILVRAKSNLGIDSGGFGYDLEQVELEAHPGIITTRVQWGEALEGSARDLLSRADETGDPEQQSATTEAMDWLLEHLKAGPVKARDVQRDAKDAGLTDKALRTAREKLGIKPTKSGFSAGWVWAIPTPEDAHLDPKVPKMPKNTEQEKLGTLGTFGNVGHLGSGPGTPADDDMEDI